MKKFCMKVKEFFKSGIRRAIALCKKNKKAILRLAGKIVIYICKTIIEKFIDSQF
ncbi:hypothetical protein [Pseudobutyrivibrio sp.]